MHHYSCPLDRSLDRMGIHPSYIRDSAVFPSVSMPNLTADIVDQLIYKLHRDRLPRAVCLSSPSSRDRFPIEASSSRRPCHLDRRLSRNLTRSLRHPDIGYEALLVLRPRIGASTVKELADELNPLTIAVIATDRDHIAGIDLAAAHLAIDRRFVSEWRAIHPDHLLRARLEQGVTLAGHGLPVVAITAVAGLKVVFDRGAPEDDVKCVFGDADLLEVLVADCGFGASAVGGFALEQVDDVGIIEGAGHGGKSAKKVGDRGAAWRRHTGSTVLVLIADIVASIIPVGWIVPFVVVGGGSTIARCERRRRTDLDLGGSSRSDEGRGARGVRTSCFLDV